MVRIVLLSLILLLLSIPTTTSAQKYDWVKGMDSIAFYSTAIDGSGNIIAAGWFGGTKTIGSKTVTAKGVSDLIVLKLNPAGDVLWSFTAGGTGKEEGVMVSLDSLQNITVVGDYWNTTFPPDTTSTQIGSYSLPRTASNHFIFRLDKDGQLKWLVYPTGTPVSTSFWRQIATDTARSTIFVGRFNNILQFGSETFSAPSFGLYFAKLNPLGQVQWAQKLSSFDTVYPIELEVDRGGNVYLASELRRVWNFRGHTFTPVASTDILVLKFSPAGELLNHWQFGGNGQESVDGFGIDDAGNMYLMGYYTSSFTLDGIVLPTPQDRDRFLMRFDQSGSVKWAKRVAAHTQYIGGLCVDPFGNSTVAISYGGTITMEDRTFTSSGNWDVILASYDDQGKRKWCMSAGDTAYDQPYSLSVDPFGSVVFSGLFNVTSRFGSTQLGPLPAWSGFIGKISEPVLLTTSPSIEEYCPGDPIAVSFTTEHSHTIGNEFIAYLSDSTGKFDTLIQIGRISGTRDSVIVAQIPKNTPPGTRYKVRVSSTKPLKEGLDRGPYFTIHPRPSLVIEARKPVDFCEGGVVPLLARGGTSYLWSTGDTSASISASVEGWYSVRALNEHGCDAIDSIKLTMHPLPTAGISANGPTTFCETGQVTLTASGGTSYLWSTGAKTNSILVKSSGNYWVKAVSSAGCEDESDVIAVVVYPKPEKPIITKDGNQLASSSITGNQWNMVGGLIMDTTQIFTPRKTGTYYVTVTDSNGCSSTSETIAVFVEQGSVAISELERSLYITPNPAEDIVEISLQDQSPVLLEVFDLLGRTVHQQHLAVGTSTIEIDVSNWQTGQYYVRFVSEDHIVTRTLQKR